MKSIILLLFILTWTGCSNTEENQKLVPYAEAIAALKPDTIVKNVDGGTMTYFNVYHLDKLIGAQLPSFKAKTLEGKLISDEYFENKISVINFWFIGCHPCEAEIPGFNALRTKYKSQPVNFLAISRNSNENLKEFFTEHPFDMDQIPYGDSITNKVFQTKWGYPLTFVADKNMKIIAAFYGGKTDSTAVQEIQDKLIPVIDNALRG